MSIKETLVHAAQRMEIFTSAVIVTCHYKPANPIVIKTRIVQAMFNILMGLNGAIMQQLLNASNHAKSIHKEYLARWVVIVVDAIVVDAMVDAISKINTISGKNFD